MGRKADVRERSTVGGGAEEGAALDGLAGAAVGLVGVALMLAVLGHTTGLALGTSVRAAAVAVAIVLGAVAGWWPPRRHPRRLPARHGHPRSTGRSR